jgi:DNA-binding GntR family transcriptional regulator
MPGSEDLVSRLKEINDGYLRCIEAGDLAGAASENDKFHATLFGACGNRFLAADIENYWQKTASIHCYAIGLPNLARNSIDEHTAMIDALQAGDRAEFTRLCIAHMQPALDAFRAAHGGWGR